MVTWSNREPCAAGIAALISIVSDTPVTRHYARSIARRVGILQKRGDVVDQNDMMQCDKAGGQGRNHGALSGPLVRDVLTMMWGTLA